MPRRKSISEYAAERIDALMKEYHDYIRSYPHIHTDHLFRTVVNRPSPRFWVSDFRAYVVMSAMFRGEPIDNMRQSKRDMFTEIFRRVADMRRKNPDASLMSLVAVVIRQPAPKFYLSPCSAKVMIYKEKKKWYEKRRLNRLR